MKKKIISLFFVVAIILSLFSCGKEISQKEPALKKMGKDEMVKVIEATWTERDSEEMPSYMKGLDEKTSFEIVNSSVTDGYYTVEVEVTSLDLKEVLLQLSPEEHPTTKDKKELDQFMSTLLEKAKPKKTSCCIYIQDEGEVTFSEEFLDAMCGGIYSYSKDALSAALMGL